MRSRLVLATDLDGTFAHGDAATRERLAGLLRDHVDATLIYVTGRAPAATVELAPRMSLPEPDVLIADVGTSVLRGFGPARLDAVEAELDRRWPGGSAVRDALAGIEELAPQAVQAPRRVSYWVEPVRRMRESAADAFAARGPDDPSLGREAAEIADTVARRAADRLNGLGVDVLLSANVYLDVLPRGVNKGSTLRRVLERLDVSEDDCVVAGDSLNDLALFETGMRAILVGNCEPALRRRVAGRASVYEAESEGVEGVWEGLIHYGHFREDPRGREEHGE